MSRSHFFRILAAVVLAVSCPRPSAADFTSQPIAWNLFPAWYPLTFGGTPARDFENTGGCVDPTKGPANFTAETDIASGGAPYNVANCNPQFPPGICCGTAASAFWSYYNGGGANDQNVNDDYLALRMRVNGDPRDSTGNCLSPSHWNFLHDFDEDGFKEWWYDAWGNQNEIRILFENIQSQQVTNDNPAPAPGTLINLLTACAVTAPALNQTSCGPGSARRECFYSHSRVCGVPALAADLLNPSVCRQGSTDATGEWFVEVQVPINFLRTNDPPAACCTEPIPLGTQVFTSFPPSIHLFFSTSDSSTDPVQKDFIASCVTTTGPCSFSDPTPVSLSYFRAERGGAGLVFEWSTASESGNVGFDVYTAGKAGWEKLTLRPVASRKPFSLARVDYRLELPGATGERFAIEDIDLYGGRRMHGPFALDKTYGLREPVATFDWSGVRAEHAARVATRAAASRAGARPGVRGTAPARLAELLVDRDGAYRVTHEQLLAAGFDFSGVAAADLALARDGRPVPIRVGGPARFGAGSFVEFLGAAATGVYTRTSVYRLAVDRAHAARMLPALGAAAARADQAPASTYRATAVVDRDRAWSFAARGDDPWYDDWVPAFAGSPVERSYTFTVDHLVPGDSRLTLDLWGMTDWAQGPDHHVVVALNGVAVGERRFDGLTDLALDLPLPAGLLVEGDNRLELTLPVDVGVEFEVVAVDRYGASYPRALVARGGELAFATGARSFTVDGFTGQRALGWQVDGERVAFLGAQPTVPGAEGRRATFAALLPVTAEPRFLVAQPSAIRTPALRAPALDPSLRRAPAQYLVIAHPDFIPGLAPLVAARRAEGLTVRVADVEKVYGEFGNGRFGPEAIRAFIRFAARELGTEMVLLVGADTYDYLDATGAGSISFVPTLYAETGPIVRRTPADALYGDLDGDDVPDLAVGRFPVRTAAELATLVAKTLAYPTAGHSGRLVAAADAADLGADFNQLSDATLAALPADWTMTRAYVDRGGLAGARSALIGALDEGVAWAQYFGHSASDVWSFSGLFTRADADALTNAGRPAVFAQWGCWNTFFVAPDAATLADRLLVGGDRGAAALLGPAALAATDSSLEMSRQLSRALFEQGLPLGAAVLEARRQVAAERPWMIDVVRGLNLLGDPALRLRD